MFGKLFFAAVFCFSSMACAKPNYQDDKSVKPLAAKECNLKFSQSGLCVDLEWTRMANNNDKGEFILNFYQPSDAETLVEPAQKVFVQLWMPSMGHGSAPVKIEQLASGKYRVYDVYFVMPGDWDIRIQLKDGTNIIDQVIYKFNL